MTKIPATRTLDDVPPVPVPLVSRGPAEVACVLRKPIFGLAASLGQGFQTEPTTLGRLPFGDFLHRLIVIDFEMARILCLVHCLQQIQTWQHRKAAFGKQLDLLFRLSN